MPTAHLAVMKITTSTRHRHTIAISRISADREYIWVRPSERRVLDTVRVTFESDPDGNAFPISLNIEVQFRRFLKSGKPSLNPTSGVVGNLLRLPEVIREAVLTEIDALGITGIREDMQRLAEMMPNTVAEETELAAQSGYVDA